MNNIIIINIITAVVLIFSILFNLQKTTQAFKNGLKMFFKVFPSFTSVIIIVSIIISLTPNELLLKYLGEESGFAGFFIAAGIGSISLLPGYIVYPIGSIVLQKGVSCQILSVFITTLLMVGIVTLPIESKYFGLKISLLRNFLSFIGAVIVGVTMGILL